LGSREAAEDVVQELFLGLWRHRHRWILSDSVRAYLFGALRNRIVSHRRALAVRERRQHVGPRAAASLPSSSSADHRIREAELLDAIEKAVEGLSPRCRETFRLVKQEHLSYAQAAEVLGVSVKAVEMNMVRALAALRKQLAEWYDLGAPAGRFGLVRPGVGMPGPEGSRARGRRGRSGASAQAARPAGGRGGGGGGARG